MKNPSTNMKNLQHSVDKLLAIWEEVEDSLIDEFMNIEEEIGGNQIVQFDTFEEVLDTFCGNAKVVEDRKHRRTTRDKWLTAEDINFIACRFEIGDRIDVKQFFNFFQDAFYSTNTQAPAAAPFQFSREWSTLKQSAQQDLVKGKKNAPPSSSGDEELVEFDEEKSVESVQEEVKPKLATSPAKKKEKPVPKVEMTKSKSEKNNQVVKDEPKKPPMVSKSVPNLPAKEKKEEPKKKAAPPPAKVFNNTLVALYASDPASFENKLERMSKKTGFIMTKEEFAVILKSHTADDNIADSDIDGVLNQLRFIGGTCSVSDLVELLAANVEAAKVAPSSQGKSKPTSKALPPQMAQGPFVNVRQQHIIDTLAALREAKLDVISTQHQANPKVFLATLKESSINNKTGVVDGTGNSITSASFNQVMRKLVPQASKKEVNTLEEELEPSIRKDTSDILLTAITSKLKLRTKEFNATASNIKKQEKLLAEEEKRNVRIEERTVKVNDLTLQVKTDSISDQYDMDPKLFMTNLKTGRGAEKTMLMTDLMTYLKDSIPKIKKEEYGLFKTDLLEADKKLNAQDPNLHITFAAVEKQLKKRLAVKTKLLKQIENEKKLLQKDLDKASTITDAGGGGCCGGGSNVHDPSATPQDLPAGAKNNSGNSKSDNEDNDNTKDSASESKSEAPAGGRTRSSSDANKNMIQDRDQGHYSSDDDDNDLPRYDPSSISGSSSSKNPHALQTADTLTYSDNGDDKSDDSGRGEDKPMNRRQMHMRRGGQGSSFREDSSKFGKPRDIDRGSSDGSDDDDSLIFGSMKKK